VVVRNCLPTVLVRGGGDLATGVAWRLHRCGFSVAVLELEHPLVIRRTVAFATAVFDGTCVVEGLTARRVDTLYRLERLDFVPVLVDPEGTSVASLAPEVLVDARMQKTCVDTALHQAPLVVALGPGFVAGRDCHCVVETQRGHFLGRVYWEGAAQDDTGVPGEIGGESGRRIVRAPADGVFHGGVALGAWVEAGACLGTVEGVEVRAGLTGTLRGLAQDGTPVWRGLKIADIDPRPASAIDMGTISDKARALGGSVVEAIMTAWTREPRPGVS